MRISQMITWSGNIREVPGLVAWDAGCLPGGPRAVRLGGCLRAGSSLAGWILNWMQLKGRGRLPGILSNVNRQILGRLARPRMRADPRMPAASSTVCGDICAVLCFLDAVLGYCYHQRLRPFRDGVFAVHSSDLNLIDTCTTPFV